MPTEEGRKLADSWKAQFLETSAKQNEVTPFVVGVYALVAFDNIWFHLYFTQSVTDVFSLLIAQIERDNGNTSEKNSCTVS